MERPSVTSLAAGLAIVASLALGGATSNSFLGDAVLQLTCVPLLLILIWYLLQPGATSAARWSALFLLVIALVPLFQVVPWPWIAPSTSNAAPIDQVTADWSATSGTVLSARMSRASSLAPRETWLALLALIPAATIFIGVSLSSASERRSLSLIVLVAGVAQALLGFLQVVQGPNSPLRFYEVTNLTEAVGLFANRNHLAALLYCSLLIAAAWAIDVAGRFDGMGGRRRFEARAVLVLGAAIVAILILVAAQTTARSRAGLGLTILALLALLPLSMSRLSKRERTSETGNQTSALSRRGGRLGLRIVGLPVGIALLLGLQFSLYRVLERFGADPMADARVPFFRNTLAAAKSLMPWGAGMGTFVPVYASIEPTGDLLAGAFANRAHNDIVELWLEAGIFGLLLAAAVMVWVVARAFAVWRRGNGIDLLLSRAAALSVLLLAIHSFVDYPLRTGAMLGVFAFMTAMLMPVPSVADTSKSTVDQRARKKQRNGVRDEPAMRRRTDARTAGQPSSHSLDAPAEPRSSEPSPGQNGGAAWGQDIKWPAAWQDKKKTTPD